MDKAIKAKLIKNIIEQTKAFADASGVGKKASEKAERLAKIVKQKFPQHVGDIFPLLAEITGEDFSMFSKDITVPKKRTALTVTTARTGWAVGDVCFVDRTGGTNCAGFKDTDEADNGANLDYRTQVRPATEDEIKKALTDVTAQAIIDRHNIIIL